MSYEVEVGRFVTIPIKRANETDLVKPLETFIRNTYDKTDDDLNKYIREFNSLRRNAVNKPLDKTVSSLQVLYHYHDQLLAASRKVPFKEASGVHVSFTWKDCLQKGKFLSSTPKISMVDGEFERLCVLFNIAALMSQVGNEANLQTDDGLKTAAKYFQVHNIEGVSSSQESAGIFTYIKDHIMSVAGSMTLTSDLSPEVLNAFRSILVAQAQECFYDKASTDASLQRKPEMLAKIAMQASHLYGESAKAFGEADGNYSLSTTLSLCNAKKDYFECRANYHQANAAMEGKRFGEAIARYKFVEPLLKSVLKSSSDALVNVNGKQFLAAVAAEKEGVEKDNNFIYNDVVPKPSQLSPIGKAPIAKAKPYNTEEHLSSKFTDMFVSLVPLAVHNALEAYEARRKELVERQVDRLKEQNTLINGVMASLNLPAALEDISGSEIPASILEKSSKVRAKGGVAPIERLLQELPDALGRNQELLTETVRILNDEQSSDAEMREKFADKWKRKPSSELTAPLRQEAHKYQTIIENAQSADKIIRGKYEENKEGVTLLCLSEPQLKQAIPSANPVSALKDHNVVRELRQLCEHVNTLKAEREVIDNELKTTPCDMTDVFMKALAEEGVLNEDRISPGELDRIYQPLIEQVSDSVGRQESILANIQRASEQFTMLRRQGGGGQSREDVLKKMAGAFDKYEELSVHLQEGNKFYSDLTELLLKLQGKCTDLVFARKTEKEELLKDLQQNIVSGSPAAPASVPSYQQDVYAQVNKPPARPPPPNHSTAPPAEQPTVAAAPPKPAPRRAQAPLNPPTTAAASAPHNPASQGPPGQYPAGGAHQQAPYAYAAGAQPPQGFPNYQGFPGQAPYSGYPQQPGPAPYPTQPQAGGFPQQGFSPYPGQAPQAGYPGGYPQQPPNYPQYGQQPPYYYPPQQQ